MLYFQSRIHVCLCIMHKKFLERLAKSPDTRSGYWGRRRGYKFSFSFYKLFVLFNFLNTSRYSFQIKYNSCTIKFSLLKCINSVVDVTFTFHDHHHCLIPELNFCHLRKKPIFISRHTHFLSYFFPSHSS